MSAREIKDLSFACEALSRISDYEAESLRRRLFTLIDNLTKQLEDEPQHIPGPKPTQNPDDEIPF